VPTEKRFVSDLLFEGVVTVGGNVSAIRWELPNAGGVGDVFETSSCAWTLVRYSEPARR
jgi:hypothetical protein